MDNQRGEGQYTDYDDLYDCAMAEERQMHPIQTPLPTGFASREDELGNQLDDDLLGYNNNVQNPNTTQQYGQAPMSQIHHEQHFPAVTSPPFGQTAGREQATDSTSLLHSAAQSFPPQVAQRLNPLTPTTNESTPSYLGQQYSSNSSTPQSMQTQIGQDKIAGQQAYSAPSSHELEQPGPLPYSRVTGDYQPDLNYSLCYGVQVIVYDNIDNIALLIAPYYVPNRYFLPGSEDKDWATADLSGEDIEKKVLAETSAAGLSVDSLERCISVIDDYNVKDLRHLRTICYKAQCTNIIEDKVTEVVRGLPYRTTSYDFLPGNRWHNKARLTFLDPITALTKMRDTQRVKSHYRDQQLQDRDAFFIFESCTPEEKKIIMRQGMREERWLSGVEKKVALVPLERWEGLLRHIDLTKVTNLADKKRIEEKISQWKAAKPRSWG